MEADIAFGKHFDDGCEGLTAGVFDGVKAIGSHEVDEKVGEIVLGFGRDCGADVLTDLGLDEFSHHLVERMSGTDSCHLYPLTCKLKACSCLYL